MAERVELGRVLEFVGENLERFEEVVAAEIVEFGFFLVDTRTCIPAY